MDSKSKSKTKGSEEDKSGEDTPVKKANAQQVHGDEGDGGESNGSPVIEKSLRNRKVVGHL